MKILQVIPTTGKWHAMMRDTEGDPETCNAHRVACFALVERESDEHEDLGNGIQRTKVVTEVVPMIVDPCGYSRPNNLVPLFEEDDDFIGLAAPGQVAESFWNDVAKSSREEQTRDDRELEIRRDADRFFLQHEPQSFFEEAKGVLGAASSPEACDFSLAPTTLLKLVELDCVAFSGRPGRWHLTPVGQLVLERMTK